MHFSLRSARGPALRNRLAVALGAVLLVAGTGPLPAFATPVPSPAKDTTTRAVEPAGEVPGGFASWEDLLAVQKKLVTAADRVTAAVQAQRGDTGFSGIVAAPENRALRVYWKGGPPAGIGDLIERLRRDVPVSVLPATFSARELEHEAGRLIRESGGAITAVMPDADGSGLTVSVSDRGQALARVTASTVPITVERGVTPSPASRWNDTSPWWAGAAMRNTTTGNGCSTGFAVNAGGTTRILSVPHCGSVGQMFTDPAGEGIGPSAYVNLNRDVMLITAKAAGRTFNNSFPPSSPPLEWSNPVVGTTASYVGMYICTSGAYTGTACFCQITGINVTINVGYVVYGMVRGESVTRKNIAGQGDSGGPVETPEPTQSTQQYALGTISFIDSSAPAVCTGYVITGRVCSWRLFYSPWSNVISVVPGATIVTG